MRTARRPAVGLLLNGLGIAGVIGAVAAVTAWSLVAEGKRGSVVTAGMALAVISGFAPAVLDLLRTRRRLQAERHQALSGLLVDELPVSVAWLLHPAKATIAFFGRTETLERLERWCTDPAASIVKVIVAPGGYGKTRLARQMCDQLEGWQTWWVAVGQEAPTAVSLGTANGGRSLLVLDYADSRDPSGLASLLAGAARARGTVRLLLLARTAGPWWTSLSASYPAQAAIVDALTTPDNVIALDVRVDAREPGEIIVSAALQFADHLGYPRPPLGLLRRRHTAGAALLRLHAEALLTVLSGQSTVGHDYDVLREVLLHELRYWRHCAHRTRLDLPDNPSRADAMLRRVAGVAALLGANSRDETFGIVNRALGNGLYDDSPAVQDWAQWLRDLYPQDLPGIPPERLGTLQPDLLAEALAVAALKESTVQHRTAILERLSRPQAAQVLTVLGRARTHQPGVDDLIDAALLADPTAMAQAILDVALQFPGLYAPRLAALLPTASFDMSEAVALYEQLPVPAGDLNGVALALIGLILERDTPDASAADRAYWRNQRAIRLAEAGHRDEALAISHEAVEAYTQLTAIDRQAHLAPLAAALNSHALRLAEAGRSAAAFAISAEALRARRDLVSAGAGEHRPGLAASINNHALRAAEMGEHSQALTLGREAVDLYRLLIDGDPSYLADLATSLNNYAITLSEDRRHMEATPLIDEAVSIYRSLARENPDAHLPGLANAVTNQAAALADTGQLTQALVSSQEAVALHRELTAHNRYVYLRGLADTLCNHATYLASAGLPAEALTTSQETVAICEELVTVAREVYLPHLARSVSNHAVRLASIARSAEATAVSERAVDLRRHLVAKRRPTYLPGLAASLNNHALRLTYEGRRTEAMAYSLEALTLYRELSERTDGSSHLPALVRTLNNHAFRLAEVRRRTEALHLTTEAVAICRELVSENRAKHVSDLAYSLSNHAARLAADGQRGVALAASLEAVLLRRERASTSRDSNLAALASALVDHSALLAVDGHAVDALATSVDAVGYYRELTAVDRDVYLPDLGSALTNHAQRLALAGRRSEALSACEEAADIYAGCAASAPRAFLSHVALSQWNIGWVHLTLGERPGRAIAATAEAVTTFAMLATDEPLVFGHRLQAAATTLADLYEVKGDHATAAAIRSQYRSAVAGRP